MLTYRGFKVERVIFHSNSGRIHRRPGGVIGIRPFQVMKHAVLEAVTGGHWAEIGLVDNEEAALVFIDQLLHRRAMAGETAA